MIVSHFSEQINMFPNKFIKFPNRFVYLDISSRKYIVQLFWRRGFAAGRQEGNLAAASLSDAALRFPIKPMRLRRRGAPTDRQEKGTTLRGDPHGDLPWGGKRGTLPSSRCRTPLCGSPSNPCACGAGALRRIDKKKTPLFVVPFSW